MHALNRRAATTAAEWTIVDRTVLSEPVSAAIDAARTTPQRMDASTC